VRLVTDYLEGALSETDVHRFDAHLTACDGCTTYLAQMQDTIRITGSSPKSHLAPRHETSSPHSAPGSTIASNET
jgi:anti-sigma factor RsiW